MLSSPIYHRYLFGFFVVMIACSGVFVTAAFAAPEWFVVTPRIIDAKTTSDKETTFVINIQNNHRENLELYALVYHLGESGERIYFDSSRVERPSSLAKWFKFQRNSIAIPKLRTTPIEIVVDPYLGAKPGMYHALIVFSEENDTEKALRNIERGLGVTVNLEILSDTRESLVVKRFVPDQIFTSGADVTVFYDLENNGNTKTYPQGFVRVYNRRGEEVASAPINGSGESLDSATRKQFASVFQTIQGIGQFKAFLDLSYGGAQQKTLQDVVFFWVIPWKQMLVAIVLLLLFVVFAVHRFYDAYHQSKDIKE